MQNLTDARRGIGDYFTRALSSEITHGDEPFGLQDANNFSQMIITGGEQ